MNVKLYFGWMPVLLSFLMLVFVPYTTARARLALALLLGRIKTLLLCVLGLCVMLLYVNVLDRRALRITI